MVYLSHSGKQHSYHIAKALKDLHVLGRFYTSSYIVSQNLQHLITRSGNTYWSRRFISGLHGKDVDANWRFEIKEIFLRKLFGKSKKVQNAVYDRDMHFDQYVAGKLINLKKNGKHKENGKSIFWGFQGSCFESLKAAKKAGMITVVELSTAHVEASLKILGEEQQLHPEWADSIDNLYFPEEYLNRLIEEPHLADYVVVASRFSKSTLIEFGVNEKKIIYLPLGVNVENITSKTEIKPFKKPIKLLFAGTITQRKGIKYLLEALRFFSRDEIELHIYGHIQGKGKAFNAYVDRVEYHGPIGQQELFRLYVDYDFLVLPSVFEGFGLVIVEAMAAGLPAIVTEHTFGSEIIEHGRNGFLVGIRSVDELRNVFQEILEMNHKEYYKMSHDSKKSVNELSWHTYTNKLEKVLNAIH